MVTTGLFISTLLYTDISHRDRKPTTGPLAPQPPPAEAPPPEVPPPPEPARTAWRNVTQRSARRGRRRSETVPPPATVPHPEMPQDPRLYAGSWATWNRKHLQRSLFPTCFTHLLQTADPNIEYTPPPAPPITVLAPPEPPRGLFGPRTPTQSMIQ